VLDEQVVGHVTRARQARLVVAVVLLPLLDHVRHGLVADGAARDVVRVGYAEEQHEQEEQHAQHYQAAEERAPYDVSQHY
jgi:hypothetical protein